MEGYLFSGPVPDEGEGQKRHQPKYVSGPKERKGQVGDVHQDERDLLLGQEGHPADGDDQRQRRKRDFGCAVERRQRIEGAGHLQVHRPEVRIDRGT